MKSLIKSIINIVSFLLLISYSCSSDPIELEENTFKKVVLTEEETQILFPITKQTSRMSVDVALSHPSEYNISLSQYDNESALINEIIESKNSKEFHLNEEEMYIHPKRRLSTLFDNQTDLIEKEELLLGLSKITLKLGKNMEKIVLTVFKSENATTNSNVEKFILVRYKLVEEEEKQKYQLSNTKITMKQEKDMLSIKFGGVKQLGENTNLTNFVTVYTISLFDKENLDSKYENVYLYECDGLKSLFSTNIKLKGEATKADNYLKIKAPLNDKKNQILLINAKVKNGDEEEQILHYELSDFKVEEESGERVWPDDKEKEKEGDKEKEGEKAKDPKEENEYILYIIMGSFGGIVILTFIAVLIYVKLNGNKPDIEEDNDYKDIGKIEPSSKKETDKGNVNEEEE
jgi:hypothetical protein